MARLLLVPEARGHTMRTPRTILSALLLCSCGGKTLDPDSTHRNDDVLGIDGRDPGAGGFGGSDTDDSDPSGVGRAGGRDAEGAPPVGSCPTTAWGGTLDGVTGALTCREPSDPANHAYGLWLDPIPAGMQVTGPLAWKRESGNLMCQYRVEHSGQEPVDWWLTIPYFGDGQGATEIPQGSVGPAWQNCELPRGPMTLAPTTEARAEFATGVWMRCGGPIETLSWEGDGVILRADGTWHTVQSDADGRLALTTGCLQGGLWGFYPNEESSPNLGQLNFYSDIGVSITTVGFYDDASRMNIDGLTDFVRVQ